MRSCRNGKQILVTKYSIRSNDGKERTETRESVVGTAMNQTQIPTGGPMASQQQWW